MREKEGKMSEACRCWCGRGVHSLHRSRVVRVQREVRYANAAYEDRNLSELKGRVKVLAQCAISVAA